MIHPVIHIARERPRPVRTVDIELARRVEQKALLDDFRRAVAARAQWIGRLYRDVLGYLEDLERELVREMTRLGWRSVSPSVLVGVAMPGDANEVMARSVRIDEALQSGYQWGARRAGRDLANLAQVRAGDAVFFAAQQTSGINQRVKNAVATEILKGLQAEETNAQLAERVRRVFERMGVGTAGPGAPNAQLIAQVTAMTGFETGQVLGFQDAGIFDIRWQNVPGRNNRANHEAYTRQSLTRRIGERFPNGLRWPHDPLGAIGERAGCACGAIPVLL